MNSNLAILVRQAIRKEMNIITDNIATGECVDYPSYKRMVGQIEGLAIAEGLLIDAEARISGDLSEIGD